MNFLNILTLNASTIIIAIIVLLTLFLLYACVAALSKIAKHLGEQTDYLIVENEHDHEIGQVFEVVNENRDGEWGSTAGKYKAIKVQMLNGETRWIMPTINQWKDICNRADKNEEEIPNRRPV